MEKHVIVTTSWDDGHNLDLKLARLLKKYNIKGTFYISPENRMFNKEDALSEEGILKIDKDFEIGAHTITHPELTKISKEAAFNEISGSKTYLENIIKKDIRVFCYPGGKYDYRTKELVKKAGFIAARTTERFCFACPEDPLIFGTTIHTYNNISDIFRIIKFSRFNPIRSLRCFFNWEIRAKSMFDYVMENGGMYHLWGHSWEIEKNNYWHKLENLLSYISNRKNIQYLTNSQVALYLEKNEK